MLSSDEHIKIGDMVVLKDNKVVSHLPLYVRITLYENGPFEVLDVYLDGTYCIKLKEEVQRGFQLRAHWFKVIERSRVEGYKEMIQNLQDHNLELTEENHKLRREMRLIKEVFRKENAS